MAGESTSTPKTDLTPADEEHYTERAYGKCPFCGTRDIEGGSVTIEQNYAHQDVSCLACEAEWSDVYRLDGICVTRTPDGRDFGHGEYKPVPKIGRIVTPEELAKLIGVPVESVKDFPFELGICEGTWVHCEGNTLTCLRPMGHPPGHSRKLILTDLNPHDWSSHLRTKKDGA